MAILEAGLIIGQKLLVENKFYPIEGFLTKEAQTNLLSGIQGLAETAFGDDVQKISLGEYVVLFKSEQLNKEKLDEEQIKTLIIYCIIEKESDHNLIFSAMENTLASFMNRYSNYDIQAAKPKNFKKFAKRIEKNFGDLALKLEDRFKTLY